MKAGRLDRRVKIQTKSINRDALGAESVSWTDLATVWATVTPWTGKEALEFEREVATRAAKFFMRYRDDFDAEAKLIHDGETYDIVYIKEVGRRDGLELVGEVRK